MANYFYVNSNNSDATAASYGTKQTGAWPTNNYGSIAAAVVDTPVAGDYIVCSDNHSFLTNSASYSVPDGVIIVCTEAADCAVESTGAEEGDTSGPFGILAASGDALVIKGLTISAEDDIVLWGNSTVSSRLQLDTCELKPSDPGSPTSGDNIISNGDGGFVEIKNSTIYPPDVTGHTVFMFNGGGKAHLINSSIASNTNKPDHLIKSVGSGGCSFLAEGSDLSNLKSGVALADASLASTEDILAVDVINCTMPASWTMGSTQGPGSYVNVSNCHSGNNRSVSGYKDATGYVITDSTTYRDASEQVEGQDVSLLVSTTTRPFIGRPFRFYLGSIYHDFSSQTYIDVQIAHDDIGAGTSSRMQNDEIYLDVEVPNSADPSFTTKSNGPGALLTYTASDHTNNSEAWTSPPTADNTQVMTVDCGASGGEGWADIYVCVNLASITIGDLSVCPTVVARAA